VAVVFIFDTHILDALGGRRDRRVVFIQECLMELNRDLRAAGLALLWRHGPPEMHIPTIVAALARTGPGARTWLSELIWREFYQVILDRFVEVGARRSRPLLRYPMAGPQGAFRGVVRGANLLPDRRCGHAAVESDGVDAQSPAHGYRQLPRQ